ncbi:MAG: hypothetical protein RIR70_1698 [Pseudomonadota bacterium]
MKTIILSVLTMGFLAVPAPLLASGNASGSASPEFKIVLPDRGFRHAGFYMAVEKGYFKAAGLNVVLEESPNPIASLIKGHATFAVSGVEALVYQSSGLPIVSLAAIFQQSPAAIITRPEKAIDVASLSGKQIYQDREHPIVEAFLKSQKISMNVGEDNTPLRKFSLGESDGVFADTAEEVIRAQRLGFPVVLISPRSAGVDLYGDILITLATHVDKDKKSVDAVREAVLAGWRYALTHVNETVELIAKKYPGGKAADFAIQEAALIKELVKSDSVELGSQDPRRWAIISQMFLNAGSLKSAPDLEAFVFAGDTPGKHVWSNPAFQVGAPAALVILFLAYRLHRVRRELAATLVDNQKSHLALKAQEVWDQATDLYTRGYFDPALERELVLAKRKKYKVALIMMDVDILKSINHRWGRAAGDAALKMVAKIIERSLREKDIVCRYDDAEIVIVLPATSLKAARDYAEELRQKFEATPVEQEGKEFSITASFGVSLWPECANSAKGLVQSARAALIQAKTAGRNRVATS